MIENDRENQRKIAAIKNFPALQLPSDVKPFEDDEAESSKLADQYSDNLIEKYIIKKKQKNKYEDDQELESNFDLGLQ